MDPFWTLRRWTAKMFKMHLAKCWLERSPCMTKSASRGQWVTSRDRRMRKEEMVRLQGALPNEIKRAVSWHDLGNQIVNSMPQNVIERVFWNLLPAAGLGPKPTRRSLEKRQGAEGNTRSQKPHLRGRSIYITTTPRWNYGYEGQTTRVRVVWQFANLRAKTTTKVKIRSILGKHCHGNSPMCWHVSGTLPWKCWWIKSVK